MMLALTFLVLQRARLGEKRAADDRARGASSNAAAVVEHRGLWAGVVSDVLGFLNAGAVQSKNGDAGCPEGMAANGFGQANGFGPPFDHVEGSPAGQRTAGHLPVTVDRAEQWPFLSVAMPAASIWASR